MYMYVCNIRILYVFIENLNFCVNNWTYHNKIRVFNTKKVKNKIPKILKVIKKIQKVQSKIFENFKAKSFYENICTKLNVADQKKMKKIIWILK